MEELSGYWEGYLIYGLGFDLPFFGERIKLTAQFTFSDGKVRGEIVEEKGPFSMKQTHFIIGFIEDMMISFSSTPSDPPSDKPFHDFDITFNGTFNPQKKVLHGAWFLHNEMEEHLDLSPAEGLWLLKKLDQKPKTDFDYSLLGL